MSASRGEITIRPESAGVCFQGVPGALDKMAPYFGGWFGFEVCRCRELGCSMGPDFNNWRFY